MYKKFGLLMLCLVSTGSLSAGSKTEETLEQWVKANPVKGISVSIFDGETVVSAVRGVRQVGGEPVLVEDRFAIASLSKSFIAAATLKVLQNKPQATSHPAYQFTKLDVPCGVTIRELLTHSSGFKEYMGQSLSFDLFLREHAAGRSAWSSEEISAFAVSGYEAAGKSFSYSNSGYIILASIIENIAGTNVASALRNELIIPFDIDSAEMITETSDMPEAVGQSEMLEGVLGGAELDKRLMRELATAGYAAGGMMANSPDLAKWAYAYFGGHVVEGVNFTEPAGGTAFGLSSDRIGVGPGVYRVKYGEQVLRIHGGDGLGSSALMALDEKTGKAVAILINDDRIRSLGFGQAGYLDELMLLLLAL